MQDFTITPTAENEISLKQEYNDRLKPTKPKKPDDPESIKKAAEKDFENSVWTTLYSIGKFTKANIDNKEADVVYKKAKRRVDVYLDSKEVTLYVEASTEALKKSKIDEIVGKVEDYRDGAEALAKEEGKNVSFIFFTNRVKDFDKSSSDLKKKGITLLSESYLEYLKDLVKNSPSPEFVYHQLCNFLFEGKRINSLNEFLLKTYFEDKPRTNPAKTHFKIPCTPGEDENGRFYLFKINPYNLLRICNVPHRRHENLKTKTSFGFQRAIKKSKIDKIVEFLKGKQGGPFPNNIVLSYNHPSYPIEHPKQTPKGLKKEQIPGTEKDKLLNLCVEPNYGMWNVIDGQHRLFSYLDPKLEEEAKRHQIIVLAYENIDIQDQVEMFVDVNEKQTAVDKNLIWDLYPEILKVTDIKHKVSKLAKNLNEKNTPLKNTIKYPSALKQSVPITMNSLCNLFLKLKVFTANSISINYLLKKLKKDGEKIDDVAEFFSTYFKALKEEIDGSTKLKWDSEGAANFVLHNMNVQAIISLCDSLTEHIIEKKNHPENHTELKAHFKAYLKPLVNFLNKTDVETMKLWRQGSKGESGWENLEKRFEEAIRKSHKDFTGKFMERENLDFFNKFYTKLTSLKKETETLEIKESFLMTIKEANNETLDEKEKKKKEETKEKIVNTLAAFANGLGGQLCVGIKDVNVKSGDSFKKVGIQDTDLKKIPDSKKLETYLSQVKSEIENQLGRDIADVLLKSKIDEKNGLRLINEKGAYFLLITVRGQTEEEIKEGDMRSLLFNKEGKYYQRVDSDTKQLYPDSIEKHFKALKAKITRKKTTGSTML